MIESSTPLNNIKRSRVHVFYSSPINSTSKETVSQQLRTHCTATNESSSHAPLTPLLLTFSHLAITTKLTNNQCQGHTVVEQSAILPWVRPLLWLIQHMCVFACVLLLLRFGGMYMCSPCKTIFHSWEEEDKGSPWESHEKVKRKGLLLHFPAGVG